MRYRLLCAKRALRHAPHSLSVNPPLPSKPFSQNSGQAPQMAETFSVHGVLDSPNLPPDLGGICGAVSGRVTVFHGGSDPFTSSENLSAFESNMHRRNAEYERVTFPGVMHAFTRPEKTLAADSAAGLQYDEAACEHTWDRIRAALSVMSGQTA